MALIDTAWRCRLMIFFIVSLLLVGDLFGYGGGMKSNHPNPHSVPSAGGAVPGGAPTGPAAAAASKFQTKNAEIDITEEHDFNELSAAAQSLKPGMAVVTGASLKTKSQLTDTIKESCLPKMLCELASKPDYQLSEKERELLRLIRSPTMPWIMNMPPSKMVFRGPHGRTHASHWRQSQRTDGMRQSLAKLPDQLQEADESSATK
ncbi:GM14967 [Drosophila sechellia]|uniref:GM14967 n=1 Tax=Drosophila sechellia TaxID=7238 RepID=B4IFQ5_DROSE|nr:GM14967 [Drosophila sechellia]